MDSKGFDVVMVMLHFELNPPTPRLMAQSKQGIIKYKGFLDVLIKIPQEEGIMAYWKGQPSSTRGACIRMHSLQ